MSKNESRSEIRTSRKAEMLGTLAGWIMRCWCWTVRYRIVDRCGITDPDQPQGPVMFALWHNLIFALPPIWWKTGGKNRRTVVLTSASKDGVVLARAMAVFGIGAVHGSSSRRAVAALVGMKRSLREGFDVCITPDGPRGPRYEFKPGIVKVAQTSKVPIVPIHASFSRAYRLKTWDRLIIPLPFSRVDVEFGEMIHLSPTSDEAAFLAESQRVENILRDGVGDP